MRKALLITALFAVLAKSAFCSEEFISFAKVSKECFDESKVDETEFKRFYMDGMSRQAATQNIKCHIKCIMEKLHHMKDGVFDVDAAMKTWSSIPEFKNNIAEIADGYKSCKSEKGTDDCDTAFLITMCLQDLEVGAGTKKD